MKKIVFNKFSKLENNDKVVSVSHTQFNTWKQCPHKWKLKYIDYHKSPPSIALLFGNAMHETIQEYVKRCYDISVKNADTMDLHLLLKENMANEYISKKDEFPNFVTKEEMVEHYNDGIEILDFLKKNRKKLFNRKDQELIGIEMPIKTKINDKYEVYFNGYIDLVFREKWNNKIIIIDLKTSRSGWNSDKKKDISTTSQLVLYKQALSKQYKVDIDNIDIKFFILKRKVPVEAEYSSMMSRIQIFEPSSGKVTTKRMLNEYEQFLLDTHDQEGNKLTNKVYQPIQSRGGCKYCFFKDKWDLCHPSKRI